VVAVGEKSPQREREREKKEKPSHKRMKPSAALGRRKGRTHIGYSGQAALRREQYDIWVVSKKLINKYVASERLILRKQLVTEHGFHGYKN
jgi:hypothetical protein